MDSIHVHNLWGVSPNNPEAECSVLGSVMLNPPYLDTVAMMLIWFFVCLVGIVPGIANGAHAAGLALGVLWGFLECVPALRRRSG